MSSAFTTRLASRSPVAPGVVDLTFEVLPPSLLVFRAGQFVTLSVGKDADGRAVRRSYSIASPSRDGRSLRLIIRAMSGGLAADFITSLPIGAEVAMTGPHGFFVLAEQHPGDVVFAATGTGGAPVLAMLAELGEPSAPGRRHVYWGLRNEEDVFLPAEMESACAAAGAQLHTYLSQAGAAWPGRRGRITSAILDRLADFNQPTFYLVGNGAMIQELKQALVAVGIDRKRQIRTEAFFD